MARVSGLRPFTEDRPDVGGRVGGRVQVQTPQARVGLRPTASPVDTYSRPARPADDGLGRLAQSLASLNPSLLRFADTIHQERVEEVDAAARAKLQGMSKEERDIAVKNGLPEFQDPWYKAAFMKQYGQNHATWAWAEMQKDYLENFDKEGGDLSEFIAQHSKTAMETLQGDKHALSGFTSMMGNYENALVQMHAKNTAALASDRKVQTIADGFNTIIEAGKSNNASPDTIAALFWERSKQNKDLMRMGFDEQNKNVIMPFLRSLAAKGDEATVNAILNHDRGNGTGRLADNVATQGDVLEIQNLAKRKALEQASEASIPARDQFNQWAQNGELHLREKEFMEWRKANPGIISDDQALSALNHSRAAAKTKLEQARREQLALGREMSFRQEQASILDNAMQQSFIDKGGKGLQFLKDVEYTTREGHTAVMSADTQRQNAIREYMRLQDQKYGQFGQNPPPEVAAIRMNEDAKWLSDNGVTFDQWEKLLNNSLSAANAMSVTGKVENIPASVQAGTALYMNLYAQNPTLLDDHVKDPRAWEFYEAYRISKQYGGLDDQQALTTAVQYMRDPTAFDSPLLKQTYETIDNAVGSLGGWFSKLGTFKNDNYARMEVNRLAKFYAMQGLGSQAAVDEAKKNFEDRHINVNGWLVNVGHRGIGNHDDFKNLAEEKLRRFAETVGPKYDLELFDIGIRPLNNGVGGFLIVRPNGMPAGSIKDSVFTMRDLEGIKDEIAEKARSEIIDQSQKNTSSSVQKQQSLSEAERRQAEVRNVYATGGAAATYDPNKR